MNPAPYKVKVRLLDPTKNELFLVSVPHQLIIVYQIEILLVKEAWNIYTISTTLIDEAVIRAQMYSLNMQVSCSELAPNTFYLIMQQ